MQATERAQSCGLGLNARNLFDRLMDRTPARRRTPPSRLLAYGVALLLVLVALGARQFLGGPDIGLQFVTFFPAVALAAVYGGFWPGMFATVASALLSSYFYLPPFREFSFHFDRVVLLSNLAFFVDEFVVCAAIQAMHSHYCRFRATSEDLSKNRNLLSAIVETAPDAIFVKDANGRYLHRNQAHLQLFGHEAEGNVGHDAFSIFPPELARAMQESDLRVVESKQILNYERTIRVASGEERSFLTTKGPFFDEAGKVQGIFGIARDITELKREKELLRQQHDRLELEVALRTEELTRSNATLAASLDSLALSVREIDDLYQNAPCGYHSVNADGIIVRINDTELSWLGYARDELVGKKRVAELLTPEAAARFWPHFLQLKESGTLRNIETEFVRKDGSVMSALLNVSAVRDERDGFVMSRATVYDVTERKQADETLRFHSNILQSLSEGVLLIRPGDGVILFANQSVEQMFGYGPNELIGKPVSVINAPGENSPEEVAEAINGELRRLGTWSGDVQSVRKDGTPFWSHAQVTTFHHPHYGEVWVSMQADITERREAEHVQKKLNRALRLLTECNTLLVHAEDEQKLLDRVCRLVVETGGYVMAWVGFAMKDEANSILPVAQFGDGDGYVDSIDICWADTERGQGPTAKAIRLGTTQINEDWTRNRALAPWRDSATKRGYQSSIAFPIFADGRTVGALSIYAAERHAFVADEIKLLEELAGNLSFGIETLRTRAVKAAAEKELVRHRRNLEGLVAERTNELAQAKRQAERANEAKSRFLAAASHDLRQPLSALKLYASVLKAKLETEDQALLESMDECVKSLSDLLSKLLDLSKLEAGVVMPRVTEFSLDDMLTKVIASYGPEAEAKGLTLRCGMFGLTARTDPVLFQRIIGNLVDNAIHYTRHGGVLVVCRRREGRRWVEVWDTGIGIPKDKTSEIFEEFKQLNDDARTQGSGLGLTIVAKTAALLGLSIRVSSCPGRGSMFAIELPLGTRKLAAAPKHRPLLPSLRIALVDDNRYVLNALAYAMEHAGHRVVAAASGSELLAELAGTPPDIMVCDYRLAGGETGFDVITSTRAAFGREVPAVIITGDTDPAIMRSMSTQGIAIQHKPVDFADLQARMDDALKQSSMA